MKAETGRFTLTPHVGQTLSTAKRHLASSEVDAIARRRSRRTEISTVSSTHVTLGEALARQRERERLGA